MDNGIRWWHNRVADSVYTSYIPCGLKSIEASIEISPKENELLAQARAALAAVDALARGLDRKQIEEFVDKEARASWQLSTGRQDNVGMFSFGAVTQLSQEDMEEIDDASNAIIYGSKIIREFPLSTRLFLRLHYIMTSSELYEKKYRGEYRRSPIWIGWKGQTLTDAAFVPPIPEDMVPAIDDLEQYINSEDNSVHPLIKAAVIHYQFEVIHPFIDANGRMGRLLNTLFLIDKGIICRPVLQMSEALKRSAALYYHLLQQTHKTGDFSQWISYFLRTIIEAASITLEQA